MGPAATATVIRLPIPSTARGRVRRRRTVFIAIAATTSLCGLVVLLVQLSGSGTPVGVAIAAAMAVSAVTYSLLLTYLFAADYRPRPAVEWTIAVLIAGAGTVPAAELINGLSGTGYPAAMGIAAGASVVCTPLLRRHVRTSVRSMLRNHSKQLLDQADAEQMIRDCEAVLATGKAVRHEEQTARLNLARALVARSLATDARDGLVRATDQLQALLADPPEDWLSLFHAAIELVEAMELKAAKHGDPQGYTESLDLLAAVASRMPADVGAWSMVHYHRAMRELALGERMPEGAPRERQVAAAVAALHQAVAAVTPVGRAKLLPGLYASLGFTVGLLSGPGNRAEAIAWCRLGQRAARWSPRARAEPDLALAVVLTNRVWELAATAEPPAAASAHQLNEVATSLHEARALCHRVVRHGAALQRMQAVEQLAEVLEAEHVLLGAADGSAVAAAWREAAHEAARTSMSVMVRVAGAWIAWAEQTETPGWCAEAYQHLMSLVPRAAAARYLPTARDRLLADVQHTAEEAGYWLLTQDRVRDAAVALELGRAVSITEAVGRERPDLPELLAGIGRPDLADRYQRATARLWQAEHSGAGRHDRFSSPAQRAWAEYDAVLRAVAEVDGTDRVTTPVTYAEVAAAAGDGPLVYLAASQRLGYAVVVPSAAAEPRWHRLPLLTRERVREQVDRVVGVDPARSGRTEREAVTPVLRWLWDNGIGYLADQLPAGSLVTIVPVGLLSLLPIHAAGGPPSRDAEPEQWHHLADRVVPRYAPNARTLVRARERAAACERTALSLLAVDAPDTDPTKPLNAARVEIKTIASYWDTAGGTAVAVPDAGPADVWQALPRFPVWHFACHCRAEPEAILDSALILAGGELTLRSLLRLPPSPRRLAVLSACDSHRSGRDLPDEAMGLPGGLLQVGLAGVIATHWRADDRAAAFLTTKFYELWREQGLAPAYALAGAQRWLRQATHGELDSYLPGVLTPPANAAPEDWARWARARPCAHAHRWASFAISGT